MATPDLAPPASAPASVGSKVSTTLNPVFRKGILVATHNRAVAKGVKRYGMRLGAGRYVAGETLDEAVVTLRGLGEDLAYANVEKLVRHAAERQNFIRMDMEESARVDPTLRIYRRLREAGHDNVGTVLQSALYRTPDDLSSLLPLNPNLRLVKGAYLEPATVAYPQKADVDAAYVRLAERMLLEGQFTGIATHDEQIIEHVIAFAGKHGIGNDRYEFQLLYGIRQALQLDLVRRGHRVLIATPFGLDWYFYLMRRLAERPANVLFFAKNLVKR